MDDVLTDAIFRKHNNVVSELFVQGRHIHTSLWVLVQSFSGKEGIPPILRKNADYIMFFYIHNINDRKSMAEQFLSMNGDTKGGMAFSNSVTDREYQMCVIDVNNTSARKYSDYVYKYSAPDKKLPKFTIQKKVGKNLLNDKLIALKDSKAPDTVNTKVRRNRKKAPEYDTYGITVRITPESNVVGQIQLGI